MNTESFRSTASGVLSASFMVFLFLVSGSTINAQPDDTQTLNFNVPKNLKLSVSSTSPSVSHDDSSQTFTVHSATWDAFSNFDGTTQVDFEITQPFVNKSQSLSSTSRAAVLKITGATGGWGSPSKSVTVDNISGNNNNSSSKLTTTASLQDIGNGQGKKPLNGDFTVKVNFKHHADDEQPSGGSWYPPQGNYKTTIEGTISGQ